MSTQSIRLVKHYLLSLTSFKSNFILIVLLSIVGSGLAIVYPYIFDQALTAFREQDLEYFLLCALGFVTLQILQVTLSGLVSYIRSRFDLFANKPIILNFYDKVQSLPLIRFKKFMNTGEIYQRVIDSLELNRMVADVITQLFLISIRLLVFIAIISYLDIIASLLILALASSYYIMNSFFSPKVRAYQEETLLSNSPLTNALFEGINKISTIKALGAKDYVLNDIQDKLKDNIDKQLRLITFSTKVSVINMNVTTVLKGVSLIYVAYAVMSGRVELSTGLALIFLIQQVFLPLQDFVQQFVDLNRAFVILDRYYNVLNEDSEETKEQSMKKGILSQSCDIEFKSVTFGYDEDDNVVEELSLKIPKGKRVALVGRSGAGKSTIMNLVLGFYKAQQGEVTIDGENINDINLTDYRKKIGVVLQDEFIFNGTIRENVSFGLDGVPTDTQVEDALKNASLWDLVSNMDKGIHSYIKEDMLSGGEKQRMILARAFLRNPNLMIFDEPTSALDMETESKIQSAMDKLLKDRTSITIAHRLSTIMKSDIIYVIDGGKIVEQGTHNDLLNNNGYYSQLYSQSLVA